METEKKTKNVNNNNLVFKKLNYIKDNRIKYDYRNICKRINKLSNNLNNFIDSIQGSIENNMSLTNRLPNKKLYTLIDYNNSTINKNERIKTNRTFQFKKQQNKNNSIRICENKKILKLNNHNINKIQSSKSQSQILENNKSTNIIKTHHKKYYSITKKGLNHFNNSILANSSKPKLNNFYKTRIYSCPQYPNNKNNNNKNMYNSIFSKNKSKKKIINNLSIYKKNKLTRPQSETKTIYEYNNILNKSNTNNNKSNNASKNLSLSLYRTNFKYFDNYLQLNPKLLNKFVKNSNNIKNSYEKDLTINMSHKTKKLLNIAKSEIDMKNPQYHQRQIFQNVLQVQKTLKAVRKMRNEEKTKVKYYGPGNINNESLMRKKNANLIKFCDSIIHMKDDKFFSYHKYLEKLYPELTKEVFKEKYQISEKDNVNERKCNENLLKIQRLFSLIEK